jgi:glycosyltransferase involved in cell wall biosynthesis
MATGDMTTPLVSVIIPAYNSEKYIAETLRSVIAQSYKNLEIIVVDDASTDNTLQVVESMDITRPIAVIKKEKNSGAAASRNLGYKYSKGSLIKCLDADDFIDSEMITNQVALVVDENNIISAQWGRFVNDDINTFKLSPETCWQTMPSNDWVCASWRNANAMTNPGIFLIPRKIIEKAGLWDETLSLLDDTEYFMKTILATDKVIFSSNSTLYYRSGLNNSLSRTKTRKGFESAFNAIEKASLTLLDKRNDHTAKLSCANNWQLFIYDHYPNYPDLTNKAEAYIQQLTTPDLPFPSGGYTKLLLNFLNWKTIKSIKQKIS